MKTLTFHNEILILAGAGSAPGSRSYVNARTGTVVDLYEAIVTNTGAYFSLATVLGNHALHSVRIEKQALAPALGDKVLIGPVDYSHPTGPRALAAWPLVGEAKAKPAAMQRHAMPPAPRREVREVGVIASVAKSGTFARVIAERTGESVFLPGSELTAGMTLRPRLRVSFVRQANPRGPVATAVTLAA